MTVIERMRALVHALCSEECAGRETGTPEGRAARRVVVEAMRDAGLTPVEQPIQGGRGANVLATIPGQRDRWVLVGAHYDHLGRTGDGGAYWGADDNAAAVAILVEVGRALARERPRGRGVVLAAFDAEEPPAFMTPDMGSDHYARAPSVPLDRIDMMVCMDLVGHALGAEDTPAEARETLVALGAERSEGTAAHIDRIARAVPGVIVRRADAETIPPLSDYYPFWRRAVPFVFLSCGHAGTYHTPEDTPDRLDWAKMAATAAWLERFTRETCARPEARIEFLPGARDDVSTLRLVMDLSGALLPFDETGAAAATRAAAVNLLRACDERGRLPSDALRMQAQVLVSQIEAWLG